MIKIFLISILTMSGLGLISGALLAFASQIFAVKVDPRLEKILGALPGANCGACGYAGCRVFAEAVIEGRAETTACRLGGAETAKLVSWIMGVEAKIVEKQVARLLCLGGKGVCTERFEYKGVKNCRAADLSSSGSKSCLYGCLSFGDCVKVCPTSAITMGEDMLPRIDYEKCIGCGKCNKACPRSLFPLSPKKAAYFVACASKDRGSIVRKICKRGCIACMICVRECHFDAIHVIDNLAVIDQEKCTHCAACFKACPPKTIIELS